MKKELEQEPINEKATLSYWETRAAGTQDNIAKWAKEGVSWEPDADQILYCQTVIPNLSEEELDGTDPDVLEAMFEGDVEGDVTRRKLYLIAMGPNVEQSKKDFYTLGDEITVRGHAYKLNLKEGTFFTVRAYDLIGRHK